MFLNITVKNNVVKNNSKALPARVVIRSKGTYTRGATIDLIGAVCAL